MRLKIDMYIFFLAHVVNQAKHMDVSVIYSKHPFCFIIFHLIVVKFYICYNINCYLELFKRLACLMQNY